jgi:hypothetical protein
MHRSATGLVLCAPALGCALGGPHDRGPVSFQAPPQPRGWKPGAAEMAAVGIAMDANPAVMILANVGSSIASEKMSAGINATAKHGANRTADVLARFFAQHGWIR